MPAEQEFDRLVAEALTLDFEGWDFSSISGRWRQDPPHWHYRQIISAYLPRVSSLLDMGTGGGEFLSTLHPLPAHCCATENYPPNLPVARKQLEPLGILVKTTQSDDALPFTDGEFELVINRHESYAPLEVKRILRPGGTFITQQVGARDNLRLNELLLGNIETDYEDWFLAHAVAELETAGFTIVDAKEDFPETRFFDIGAVVFYMKAIPWQIPDFDVQAYREKLLAIHHLIRRDGALTTTSHRFLIEARS